MLIDIRKNITFTSSNEINNIASPIIEFFNFKKFAYSESFADGSRLILTSNVCSTIELYHEEIFMFAKHSSDDVIFPDLYEANETYCVFYSDHSQVSGGKRLRSFINRFNQYKKFIDKNFGVKEAFIIIKKDRNICRAFIFSMDRNSCSKFDIIQNLDLLKHFTIYFENAALNIIKAARNQEKIIKPWREPSKYYKHDYTFPNVLKRKNFIEKTKIKKLYLDYQGANNYLTNAELQCALQLAYGKTAKEIARVQGISKRTVEKYMENIKQKLFCSHRSQVVDFIFDKGINRILR